jgi:low affinity Fe/Cu permease
MRFDDLAWAVSHQAGRPWATAVAFAVIVVWALSGPLFDFSETWQLWINTGTTIVTFLMVFLIQATQNRDTAAVQAKLDALIHGISRVSDEMMDVDSMTEDEIAQLRRRLHELPPGPS